MTSHEEEFRLSIGRISQKTIKLRAQLFKHLMYSSRIIRPYYTLKQNYWTTMFNKHPKSLRILDSKIVSQASPSNKSSSNESLQHQLDDLYDDLYRLLFLMVR